MANVPIKMNCKYKVKFFDPGRDYLRFEKEYDSAWKRINKEGKLILQEDVQIFEENLAQYIGTRFAVGLNSGTDAIYLSVKALGIKGGVALPSHTFKSTCGAVINAGAIPIVYDLNGIVNELTEAHIPVHIAGELSPISDLGIPVIEDSCQAFGAIKNPTTSVQCWSFYPAKILGAKGDAGAITTNDYSIYEYVKEARNHFKSDNRDFGINSRMDNLQAALLNIKIQHIDEILNRRKEIAEKYLKELNGIVGLPNNQVGRVWQDFIVQIPEPRVCGGYLVDEICILGELHNKCGAKNRNATYEFLKKNGIETMKNEYSFSPEYPKLPLAAKYEAETLRIPCNEHLLDEEQNYVIAKIKQFYANSL